MQYYLNLFVLIAVGATCGLILIRSNSSATYAELISLLCITLNCTREVRTIL
jgi:hypothetical protein